MSDTDGLLIIQDPDAYYSGLEVRGNRDTLLAFLRSTTPPLEDSGAILPVTLRCVHGSVLEINTPEDVPATSTRMPCGHPDCWAIHYEEA